MSNVEAIKAGTSTREPGKKITPFGFTNIIWPLELKVPKIEDGSTPTTRLRAIEPEEG